MKELKIGDEYPCPIPTCGETAVIAYISQDKRTIFIKCNHQHYIGKVKEGAHEVDKYVNDILLIRLCEEEDWNKAKNRRHDWAGNLKDNYPKKPEKSKLSFFRK